MRNFLKVILLLAFFVLSQNSFAQQLVYTPINPSFGGSPLNGNWMLSQAQVQNGFTAGETGIDSRYGSDPLADFTASLNRQILSQLSRNLISSMFGETGLEAGRYQIGDYMIDITQGADGITIIIFDLGTGGETTIIIPYL
ncbi:MAG: curli assembly protein CsgF [Ignavibacteriaceae bacterium]|nr:curli assembly protein CsgF [Ignavibacteriaceae bacterium]